LGRLPLTSIQSRLEKKGLGVIILLVLHTSFASAHDFPIVFGYSEEIFPSGIEEA
jgi:hypothetical protein